MDKSIEIAFKSGAALKMFHKQQRTDQFNEMYPHTEKISIIVGI